MEQEKEIHRIDIIPTLVEGFKDNGDVIAYCLIDIDGDKGVVELRGFKPILFENVKDLKRGKLVYLSFTAGKGFTSMKTMDCELEEDDYYRKLIANAITSHGY